MRPYPEPGPTRDLATPRSNEDLVKAMAGEKESLEKQLGMRRGAIG